MSGKWIPNILTIVNLLAGLEAIVMAVSGHIVYAALFVLAAAMFDNIEARIVRRLNAGSRFGRKFDHLADLVAFGLAPVVMTYQTGLSRTGFSGFFLAALFLGCAIIRQTRLDAASLRGYYTGLPLAAAGLLLAGTAVFGETLPYEVTAVALIVLSGLMLSTIKVRKF